MTEANAFKLERKLIKHFGRITKHKGPLANFTDGGEGVSGLKFNAKTLKKMKLISEQLWKNKDYVQKQLISRKKMFKNPIYIQTMKKCHKKHNKKTRMLITNALKKKWKTKEYRQKQANFKKRFRKSNSKKISKTLKKYFRSKAYKDKRSEQIKIKKYKVIYSNGNIIKLHFSELKKWCKKHKISLTEFGRNINTNIKYKGYLFEKIQN
jgi:hypothetical protein